MLYNFKGLLLCVCECAHKIVSNITIGEVLMKSFHYNLYHNTHNTHGLSRILYQLSDDLSIFISEITNAGASVLLIEVFLYFCTKSVIKLQSIFFFQLRLQYSFN